MQQEDSDQLFHIQLDVRLDGVPGEEAPARTVLRRMETLYLVCEWGNCFQEWDDWRGFWRHVLDHLPAAGGDSLLQCWWSDCRHEEAALREMERHVNLHTYQGSQFNIHRRISLIQFPRYTLLHYYTKMTSPAMLRLDPSGEAGVPRKQRPEQRHVEGVAAAELPGWEVPAGWPGGDTL